MLLPPGTRVLSARSCRGRSRDGHRQCLHWFCGHPKAAKCGLRAAGELGLFLGAVWGVMLQHWDWGSSCSHRSFTPGPACSPLVQVSPCSSGRDVHQPPHKIKDPQQETLPLTKPFLQFKGSFAGEVKISWKVSHNRARRRNVPSSSGTARMCFVLAPLV